MRVSELLQKKAGTPVISFEVSRPKTPRAAAKLRKALAKLKSMEPDYVSVTFGAGGSERDGSIELVQTLKDEFGFPVVAYLAGVGMGPDDVAAYLDACASLGVETIFTIRGDAPTWDEGWSPHPDALAHASDLIALIKERYPFCVGAAAYPEGHIEAESRASDLEFVKLKQDRGAEYVVAQYFYDNSFYFDLVEEARASGITVPVIPGVMPIYSVKLMESLAKICGATITPKVRDGLAALPEGEKGAVSRFGVELATGQCAELLQRGVPGLHFYTMNRANSIVAILTNLREQGLL